MRIYTSKEESNDGVCYIAYSDFLGKYSCHEEGETRLEAIKNYLKTALEFIEFLETEGHGEKLNEELESTQKEWV